MTNNGTPCISGGYVNAMTEDDSDLIRRSDALDCFHSWVDKYDDVHTPDEMPEYRAIEALPSVEQEPEYTMEEFMYGSGLRKSRRWEFMMNDLISRQAAIDAIKTWGLIDGLSEGQAIEILADEEKLPSAQPEQAVQEILNYLDTELHPLVSPEHWNVYSELHDMISTLPSAQPERKPGRWIDDNCSECGQYVYHGDARNFCPTCGARMEEEYEDGENESD